MTRAAYVLVAVMVCVGSVASVGRAAAQPVPPADGWVVLPLDDYDALRARAATRPPSAGPPVEATLTRVDYDLALASGAVTGTARLLLDVLRDGWVQVPLPAGLLVRQARLDGQPLALTGGATPHVWLARPGRSVLTLDLVLASTAAAGAESIVLPASGAAITRATLRLPDTGFDLRVEGGVISAREAAADGTRFTVHGAPRTPATLSWRRRIDDRRATQPLRLRADVAERVSWQRELVTLTATVALEVVEGMTRDVRLTPPAGLTVTDVRGAEVDDWRLESGDLRVRLLDASTTAVTFVVQAEGAPPPGRLDVPLVRVREAERETGLLAIDIGDDAEITRRDAVGLEPADAADVPPAVSARAEGLVEVFRRRPLTGAQPRGLTLTVARYEPQAVPVAAIDEARHRVLLTTGGPRLVQADYVVRNNQRTAVSVTLPPGARVWSVMVGGAPVRAGLASEGRVLVPLDKARVGDSAPAIDVTVVYAEPTAPWPERGSVAIALPVVDLPVARSLVLLHHDPRVRVTVADGLFRRDDAPVEAATPHRGPPVQALATPAAAMSPEALALIAAARADVPRAATAAPPIGDLAFPGIGPAVQLRAELLPASQPVVIDLNVRRLR